MRNRTWRWVPRDSVKPVEENKTPDSLEVVDDSKDGPGVSRHGGHDPEPQRVSEPGTWQRLPDVHCGEVDPVGTRTGVAGRNFHGPETKWGPTRPIAPAHPFPIHPGGEGSQRPGYGGCR